MLYVPKVWPILRVECFKVCMCYNYDNKLFLLDLIVIHSCTRLKLYKKVTYLKKNILLKQAHSF